MLKTNEHTKNLPNMGGMDLMAHRASITPSLASSGDFSVESESGRHRQGPYLEGNMKLLATVECPADVMCNRFSDDGSLLAVGLIDGSIKIYESDPLTCNCLHSLQDDETVKAKLPVTQIRFKHFEAGDKPEHKRVVIASYASGMVKFWHFTTGKCLHTIHDGETSQILTLSVNPDNTMFCTTGDNPQIHLYDMETLKRVNTLEPSEASDGQNVMDGHQCRVFALMYHPTIPHVFLSGGWDDTVQFWDDRKRHAFKHISGPHICGDAIDIDPRHNHILTGSWCTGVTLQIWDFNSAKKIKDVPPEPLNNTMVYCCQWLGHDSIICGGHNHNMARIIDRGTLNTTGQLLDLQQSVYCLDNDHKGSHPRVAIGSQNFIYIVREEKKAS
ncbi:uncharacterized protein LOC132760544 isoform X2 [Ruditapes philippinarum]|uniref:uncharacterized protein LOC132760544 isoform X2 n=1 Tax=Ruditapes philippinarum TaxID=129788 RepID=UPI00295BEC7A|nr:uncharacterized protein LOC132760544 isoform X2 [Ruditapes philippinarum]